MNKVAMNFHSKHTHENEKEEIRYTKDVNQYQEDNFAVLSYLEPNDDGSDNINCQIKYNDNEIHVYREGDISSEIHLYKDGQSFGAYDIMGYTIDLNVNLKDLKINDTKLVMEYDLMVDQVLSGNFKINIEIQEER